MGGKLLALLLQVLGFFVALEFHGQVRVVPVPAGEVFAVEDGTKALGRRGFSGRQRGGDQQEGKGKQRFHGG